jgi:tRNA A37 methylthiotransferase MiaB
LTIRVQHGGDTEEVSDGAIARSHWDAPEIDGSVFLNGDTGLKPGDLVEVTVDAADEYDLWATRGCAEASILAS